MISILIALYHINNQVFHVNATSWLRSNIHHNQHDQHMFKLLASSSFLRPRSNPLYFLWQSLWGTWTRWKWFPICSLLTSPSARLRKWKIFISIRLIHNPVTQSATCSAHEERGRRSSCWWFWFVQSNVSDAVVKHVVSDCVCVCVWFWTYITVELLPSIHIHVFMALLLLKPIQ